MVPHPDKLDKGGEDSLYINDHIVSIADGVGGWKEH